MSELLKPQFFIVRDNGIITPLVATDELPHHIRLEGVPRNMNVEDTQGMTNVGKFPARHQQYKVINLNDKPKHISSAPPNSSSSSLDGSYLEDDTISIAPSSNITTQLPRKPLAGRDGYPPINPQDIDGALHSSKKSYGIQEQEPNTARENHNGNARLTQDLTLVKPASKSGPNHPAEAFHSAQALPTWKDKAALGSRFPQPGKKVYCSHWMSTGECDFAQQGCMYKHEMPYDIDLLNLLGFQDIPKWYRERYGIGKLTAVPGSGAHVDGPNTKQRPVAQNGRKPHVYPQVTNSAYRPPPARAFPKNGNGPRQFKHHNTNNRPPHLAGKKSGTAGLLDSRYAPLLPSNSKGSTADSDGSGDGSAPSNESNTSRTVITSPTPLQTTAVIAQARPSSSSHRNNFRPLRGEPEPLLRRDSVMSDFEAEIYTATQQRRISEEEDYLQACRTAQKAKEKQVQDGTEQIVKNGNNGNSTDLVVVQRFHNTTAALTTLATPLKTSFPKGRRHGPHHRRG